MKTLSLTHFFLFRNIKQLTQDMLGNCVFGLPTRIQNNEANLFFQQVEAFIASTSGLTPFLRFNSNSFFCRCSRACQWC